MINVAGLTRKAGFNMAVITVAGKTFEIVKALPIRADYFKGYDDKKQTEQIRIAIPTAGDSDIPLIKAELLKREVAPRGTKEAKEKKEVPSVWNVKGGKIVVKVLDLVDSNFWAKFLIDETNATNIKTAIDKGLLAKKEAFAKQEKEHAKMRMQQVIDCGLTEKDVIALYKEIKEAK